MSSCTHTMKISQLLKRCSSKAIDPSLSLEKYAALNFLGWRESEGITVVEEEDKDGEVKEGE